jgi:hypothetical protein
MASSPNLLASLDRERIAQFCIALAAHAAGGNMCVLAWAGRMHFVIT